MRIREEEEEGKSIEMKIMLCVLAKSSRVLEGTSTTTMTMTWRHDIEKHKRR